MSIKFNLQRINNSIDTAFQSTAEIYAEALQEALSTPSFDWPGETQRQNGQIAGSPRDAVDTRDLIDSQQPVVIEQSSAGITASIEYTSDHAAVVYSGKDDQDNYPGRKWDEAAQEAINLTQIFAQELRREL